MVIAGALVVGAPATADEQTALERARQRIEQVEAELGQARGRADDAAAALADAERRLAALEQAVNEVGQALERQQQAVTEAEQRVDALQAQMDAQVEAFSRRAADMFKRGVGVPFEAILDAGSIQDAIGRSAYVQALSSSDQASLEAVTASRTAVAAERELLAAERDRLAGMKEEQERMLAQVAELRRHRALQLASAESEVESLTAEREDLTAESQRLTRIIRQRQEEAAAAARRAAEQAAAARRRATSRSGRGAVPRGVSTAGYIWPRCDSVTSEYGWRWGRRHTGIDIDGETGDPIYAAKGGVVIYSGWQGGYGRLVLVSHGDGVVTAYAHQSAFAVSDGESVSQGQRIGSVGNTGNSTGSHLHFETRVNGEPVNPRQFLPGSC